jgi:FKBP-type peptidyl-prolyl cis-trans isomerase FkpA/FKBP-type peptidyl-prolyl cis-trans isomerase FklB
MSRTRSAAVSLALLLAPLAVHAAGPAPASEDDKAFYAFGSGAMGAQLAPLGLSEHELDMVLLGVRDAVLKKPAQVDVKTYQPKFQEIARQRVAAATVEEKKTAQAFVDKAAGEKGATKLPSGMVIQEITPGTGAAPAASDKVKVHYHGTLTDGTVFDSSVQRGQPATFGLSQVIKCWTEGLQKMKVGGKAKLVCPSDLAYGDAGRPPKIKGGATLVFEVELLEIVGNPAASPAN